MKRLMLGAVTLALACGGGGKEGAGGGSPASGAAPAGAPAAPLGNATITGTVSFTGTPPANPRIDMSEEPVCKGQYTTPPTEPIVVVHQGKLANVFVYVKSGLPAGQTYPTPTTPVVLDQQGCLYHPRILGVMVHQPIEILNGDAVLHNIKAVPTINRGFNISQPQKGMHTTRTFDQVEMPVPIECNVHGWMHGKVFVMAHPYFAVSDSSGAFTIRGLPAGTYTLTAWHETLGTKTATVTVPAGGTATASFSFGK